MNITRQANCRAAIFAAIGDVGQNDDLTNVFVRIDVGIFICADNFDIDN